MFVYDCMRSLYNIFYYMFSTGGLTFLYLYFNFVLFFSIIFKFFFWFFTIFCHVHFCSVKLKKNSINKKLKEMCYVCMRLLSKLDFNIFMTFSAENASRMKVLGKCQVCSHSQPVKYQLLKVCNIWIHFLTMMMITCYSWPLPI